MTIAHLKEEIKVRDSNSKGLSVKGKDWLLNHLGIGTELRGSTEFKARIDAQAKALDVHQSTLCHVHPLAYSSQLRAPAMYGLSTSKKRVDVGRCNGQCLWLCRATPYLTCELCDFDICKRCYEIESLPPDEKDREVERRLDKTAAQEAENQRRFEAEERVRLDAEERRRERYEREHEQRMEELYGDDLKRFPQNVKKPHATNKDESNKFKYTVWAKVVHRKQFEDNVEKEFDSSFATLNEANLRVEYAFYYKNPWGCNKDEVNADEDMELSGGLRYMRSNPDGGGSLTVSVMPSVAFNCLQTTHPRQGINHGGSADQRPVFPVPFANLPLSILMRERGWSASFGHLLATITTVGTPTLVFRKRFSTLRFPLSRKLTNAQSTSFTMRTPGVCMTNTISHTPRWIQ
jgi:hypothetical protein